MSFFSRISDQYSEVWKAIIRPPRDGYTLRDLGPLSFPLRQRVYQRTDIELQNRRGLKLSCSHFEPSPSHRPADILPCVIYLHGNCSSRMESLGCLHILLPLNITVFGFDFSGSGQSEGEFVSLGWHERDDLETVIEYLRESKTVSCIGLWGRSMGAVTALLHGDRDPSIAGMVLDSPFSSLRKLAEELTESFVRWKIPKFLVGAVMNMIRNTIQQKAQFDIDRLVPINHVRSTYMPALFVAAKEDRFILPHHSKELHEAYAGDKNLVEVEGDHNSVRPRFLLDSVSIFFHGVLQCDQIIPSGMRGRTCVNHLMPSKLMNATNGSRNERTAAVVAASRSSNEISSGQRRVVNGNMIGYRPHDLDAGDERGVRANCGRTAVEASSSRRRSGSPQRRKGQSKSFALPVDETSPRSAQLEDVLIRAGVAPSGAMTARQPRRSPLAAGQHDEDVDIDALLAVSLAAEGFQVRYGREDYASEDDTAANGENILVDDVRFGRNENRDGIPSDVPAALHRGESSGAASSGGIVMRPPDLPCHFERLEDGNMELVGEIGELEEILCQEAIRMSLEASTTSSSSSRPDLPSPDES